MTPLINATNENPVRIVDFLTLEIGLLLITACFLLVVIGFIIGLSWGPDRNVEQSKLVGYAITFLWLFMHIAAVIVDSQVDILVDVIMAIFATSIYGDDFVSIFANRFLKR